MKKLGVVVLAGGALLAASSLAAPAAKAQEFQLCNNNTYCTSATNTIDVGTTTNTNPTFDITITAQTAPEVDLVALIPDTASVSPTPFTASFNSGAQTDGIWKGTFNSASLWDVLGITKGPDYNFSSFTSTTSGPDANVTGFNVYEWGAGTNLSSSGQISVSFGSGTIFPVGADFLAVGTNTDGSYYAKTPFTTQLEVVSVPETGSKGMLLLSVLSLFGTFLLLPRLQRL
jgi:hypothetical protein